VNAKINTEVGEQDKAQVKLTLDDALNIHNEVTASAIPLALNVAGGGIAIGGNVLLALNETEAAAKLTNADLTAGSASVTSDLAGTVSASMAKLDALEDLIEGANGKPLLVAYWFKHDLTRIVERLDALGVVYGKLDSDQSIEDWNAGRLEVGLIHPASAGHGLNLQSGGNTLVWFGMIWSLELYQQTVARLWRQGQESGTVVVQHIITADTIDEMILKALSHKGDTQSRLIDAVKAEVSAYGRK
jgi:SNF2 family DNA or RNA helicase